MTNAADELEEIEANFERFSERWRAEQATTAKALLAKKAFFVRSYQRVVTLHAWRVYVLEPVLSPESLAFFVEAQNDSLVSHVLAQQGSWRVALKALRSCLENVLFALYYKDHPVELALWRSGSHKLAFSELLNYFEHHPDLRGIDAAVTGLRSMKTEFATLSSAVHGSSQGFRMTRDGKDVMLWSAAKDRVGAWSKREAEVLRAVNALLIVLYRVKLAGAALPGLRRAVGRCLSKAQKAKYRSLKVAIR